MHISKPRRGKTMLAYRHEVKYTNNTVEYEALVQGLCKAIGLDIKYLQMFGDSKIEIKHVRNTIHYLSQHLKCYPSLF